MHTIFLHVELDDILMAAYKNVLLDLGGGGVGGDGLKRKICFVLLSSWWIPDGQRNH